MENDTQSSIAQEIFHAAKEKKNKWGYWKKCNENISHYSDFMGWFNNKLSLSLSIYHVLCAFRARCLDFKS